MKNDIASLTLIPSLYCNLQCDHCCRSSGPNRRERMSDEILSKIFDITHDQDFYTPELTISGGEPLIWRKHFLMQIVHHLPTGVFGSVYIVTNGTWTQKKERRRWFLRDFLPELKDLLSSYADLGLTIDLSRDQYHYADVERSWQQLKYESEDGIPAPDWSYDDWYYPDMDNVAFTERPTYMKSVLPIGRGKDLAYMDDNKQYCHFDGNDRVENQLTIWPDGRVSACCDGGAWVGNIMLHDWREILKNRRRFLFHLRREVGTYNEEKDSWNRASAGVPISTCADCRRIGRQYFNTSFRR